VPAFTVHSGFQIVIFGTVFLLLTGLWSLPAYSLVHHARIDAPFRRFGNTIALFLLIGIGILAMYEVGSFRLFFH
jgi:cadmium resistance protein CadD (predicted permease)